MRTRSQEVKITNNIQTLTNKVDHTNTELNNTLKDLHGKMIDIDKLIYSLRIEQLENVKKFRQICLERKQQNNCRNCKAYSYMTKKVEVKPISAQWELSLNGYYENTIYLCSSCGRPGIELKSYDSDYGIDKISYM